MDKFKAYQQQMEKALRAFECTTEWADLVNALGKVNKVLLNYPQFSKIPCDAILGRRLAQCLHPDLPNGVQLKALETYDLLFKAIGSDNLMQELSKFSNGLFPLLSHADLNVKPTLLSLYEDHFLPLNERLRPALDGFLIATLHGLEENTDFIQRTDDLLMKVCAGVGPEFFYGSLWRCILIDPLVRLHGMNFLITHFNKKRPLESQLHILGNSLEALVEAICVSLLDIRNVLVQRAALDLLLCCFPLHNQQVSKHDMIKLATGAVTVLLRRDTSLSRRLKDWLFNMYSTRSKKAIFSSINNPSQANSLSSPLNEPRKSQEQREKERKISYFKEYAQPLLLEAFDNCLSDPSKVIDIPNCWSSLGDFWPYRLLICLIDHSELCELIIDDLCLEILRALCIDFRRDENQRPEFIRTVRLLLTSMNISYLWTRVYNLMAEVCQQRREFSTSTKDTKKDELKSDDNQFRKVNSQNIDFFIKPVRGGSTNILELSATYTFMMECFPIENYIDMAKEFLPKVLINLINLMIDYCDILEVEEYLSLIKVVGNIFEGVRLLHRDTSVLKVDSSQLSTLNPVTPATTPLRSNQISLVAEDEEYITEEAIEPSNDGSNNATDENIDKSLTGEKQSSNSPSNLQQYNDYDEKVNGIPNLQTLIDNFQYLFHNFVNKRLLLQTNNLGSVYLEFSKLLEQKYLDRRHQDMQVEDLLKVNEEFIQVYENFCKVIELISTIPTIDESVADAQRVAEILIGVVRPDSNGQSGCGSIGTYEQNEYSDDQPITRNDCRQQPARSIESSKIQELRINLENSPDCSLSAQAEVGKKMSFQLCKPYIQDLMLLSYKVRVVKINYASMNLLLDILSTSQLALDSEFASANQLVASIVPSFSEELNASVVAADTSLIFNERRSSENTSTAANNNAKRLLLTEEEFYFITKHTCWFSLAMKILWQYLSSESKMRLETVELIQNMHNLTHQTLVCEDIICASLNSSDEQVAYDARRRFILLFSLMKCDRSYLNLKQREFERPLFFMLDSLSNKMDPFNCIAKDWLTQVYKFRTTARVLEPILKILLHPDTARTPIIFTKINLSNIHHTHMHLYPQVYDSRRILYALNTLWNVLTTDPHQGLIRMANSNMKGCYELHLLYTRHNNTMAGNNFHDEVTVDNRGQVPSFLELTIIACLNFLSSYYLQLPDGKLSQADLHGNQKVRMLASEILRTIFSNLFDAIKGCPTGPIHEMLNRCKAQEIVLLHIATSVQCAQHQNQQTHPVSSSEQIIHFNETSDDNSDDFQRTLLRLLEELMILEYRVAPPNVISETENHSPSARTRDIPDISSNSLKYFYNILISSQRLFLSAVKAALQNIQRSDLHINWLTMIETTIPISGRSLTRWIGCVIFRLCDNLEIISNCIIDKSEPISIKLTMTPKYLSIIMNSLSYVVHYCLLDNHQLIGFQSTSLMQRSESLSTLLPSTMNALSYTGGMSSGTGAAGSTTTLTSTGTSGSSSLGPVSHVMSNIFHVFSNDQGSESGIGSSQSGSTLSQNDPIIVARKEVLNRLSQIIFAIIQVWKVMNCEENSLIILGAPADVKKQILALLSPISLRYGVEFMNAIAFVWHELKSKSISRKDVIPPCSPDQSLLVEIVASISDLPMESVLQTTRQVISKTQESRAVRRVPLEVGLLQFFLAYIRLFPGSQLIECWKPLLQLLRDGLQLGRPAMPQAQFTLLALLHEFVQTAPLIEDRKDQKDLQDVAQKLIDSLTTVVGTRLSQSRWLRRGPEVEPGPQSDVSEDDEMVALNALAEYVAPVLDVVYASDEKEKVVNLINGIMYYVMPYLKNHLKDNMPSFLACSHLLSSISGYQYTRKAWRKDTLELLMDSQFFQMDSQCMVHWRVIVDHLMTHDKTTFRDFLAKISPSQSALQGGPLKLFASRDQESEQRAQLIKRMAFMLFCSERDQYHKYTPDIQEKLIESLRDNPSDQVQSQIMLCFRVLIIRSSAHLLTSLWPFVYTEMVQGLLDIESYLEQTIANAVTTNADQQQIQSNLKVTASTGEKFQLFLYTCAGDDFEPHLVRIERRLTELSACPTILPYRNHYPILTLNKIGNLLDLHPFFKTLIKVNRCEYELMQPAATSSTEVNQSSSGVVSDQPGEGSEGNSTTQAEISHFHQPPALPLNPFEYDDPNKFIGAILESDFLV